MAKGLFSGKRFTIVANLPELKGANLLANNLKNIGRDVKVTKVRNRFVVMERMP